MTTQSTEKAIYRITEWAHPTEMIQTGTGPMLWKTYLQVESDRWKETWKESWVQENSEGLVALFTWAGDQKPVDGDDAKE